MDSASIGRRVLFKYVIISIATFLGIIPVIVGTYVRLSEGLSLTLTPFLQNIWNDAINMKSFLIVQVVVMTIAIWLLGGLAGRKILDERRGKFKIGFLTILGLWCILSISSILTEMLTNAFKWGPTHSPNLMLGFILYGIVIYIGWGVLHGLTMGYFIGNGIEKLNNNTPTKPKAN